MYPVTVFIERFTAAVSVLIGPTLLFCSSKIVFMQMYILLYYWANKMMMISGVLGGIRGYTPYTNLRVFLTAYILTSVIINKQGTFRSFATPVCVYPPPFLAIHH